MNFPTIPTVEKLKELNLDVYDTIKYCQTDLQVSNPSRSTKPYLPTNHSHAGVLAYAAALDEYETVKATYDELCKEVRYHNNLVGQLIDEYIIDVSGLSSIPEQYQAKVFSYACMDADNRYDVFCRLENLIDIFK